MPDFDVASTSEEHAMATPVLEATATELPPVSHIHNVLVPSDGLPQSDGALIAGQFVQGFGETVAILGVQPPMPMVSPEAQLPIDPELEARIRLDVRDRLSQQARRVLGPEADFEVAVEI